MPGEVTSSKMDPEGEKGTLLIGKDGTLQVIGHNMNMQCDSNSSTPLICQKNPDGTLNIYMVPSEGIDKGKFFLVKPENGKSWVISDDKVCSDSVSSASPLSVTNAITTSQASTTPATETNSMSELLKNIAESHHNTTPNPPLVGNGAITDRAGNFLKSLPVVHDTSSVSVPLSSLGMRLLPEMNGFAYDNIKLVQHAQTSCTLATDLASTLPVSISSKVNPNQPIIILNSSPTATATLPMMTTLPQQPLLASRHAPSLPVLTATQSRPLISTYQKRPLVAIAPTPPQSTIFPSTSPQQPTIIRVGKSPLKPRITPNILLRTPMSIIPYKVIHNSRDMVNTSNTASNNITFTYSSTKTTSSTSTVMCSLLKGNITSFNNTSGLVSSANVTTPNSKTTSASTVAENKTTDQNLAVFPTLMKTLSADGLVRGVSQGIPILQVDNQSSTSSNGSSVQASVNTVTSASTTKSPTDGVSSSSGKDVWPMLMFSHQNAQRLKPHSESDTEEVDKSGSQPMVGNVSVPVSMPQSKTDTQAADMKGSQARLVKLPVPVSLSSSIGHTGYTSTTASAVYTSSSTMSSTAPSVSASNVGLTSKKVNNVPLKIILKGADSNQTSQMAPMKFRAIICPHSSGQMIETLPAPCENRALNLASIDPTSSSAKRKTVFPAMTSILNNSTSADIDPNSTSDMCIRIDSVFSLSNDNSEDIGVKPERFGDDEYGRGIGNNEETKVECKNAGTGPKCVMELDPETGYLFPSPEAKQKRTVCNPDIENEDSSNTVYDHNTGKMSIYTEDECNSSSQSSASSSRHEFDHLVNFQGVVIPDEVITEPQIFCPCYVVLETMRVHKGKMEGINTHCSKRCRQSFLSRKSNVRLSIRRKLKRKILFKGTKFKAAKPDRPVKKKMKNVSERKSPPGRIVLDNQTGINEQRSREVVSAVLKNTTLYSSNLNVPTNACGRKTTPIMFKKTTETVVNLKSDANVVHRTTIQSTPSTTTTGSTTIAPAAANNQKFYLLRVDGKTVLIPCVNTTKQPKAFIINEKSLPLNNLASFTVQTNPIDKKSTIQRPQSTTKVIPSIVSSAPVAGQTCVRKVMADAPVSASTTNSKCNMPNIKPEPITRGYGDEKAVSQPPVLIKQEKMNRGYSDEPPKLERMDKGYPSDPHKHKEPKRTNDPPSDASKDPVPAKVPKVMSKEERILTLKERLKQQEKELQEMKKRRMAEQTPVDLDF